MKNKIIKLLTLSSLIGCTISSIPVSAVSNITYQTTINPEFTINDSLSVSLSSSDLVISDLVPGQSSDSNVITVTASSNHSYGYVLGSTVGSSTSPFNTDALVNSIDHNATFTNLTGAGSLSAGEWGYSYATYDPTNSTWQSWSTYDGLPLYNSTADTLATTYTNGSTTVQFKIGAYADTDQPSGEYNNIINFTLTANPEPHYYMQDFTLSQCAVNVGEGDNPANVGDNITVYDRRDEKDYTVRYINSGCWMTQNLRITGIVSAEGSNFTGSDFNVSQYSLDANDVSYANHCDSTNGYNYACAKDSGSTTTGVWYNYYAASAGTIATDNNSNPATEDICPSNWHLPSGPNTTEGTDFNKLIGNTTSGWQTKTTSLLAFDTVAGGYYTSRGLLSNIVGGYWWSATASDTIDRSSLYCDSSNDLCGGSLSSTRYLGYFVRCVHSS